MSDNKGGLYSATFIYSDDVLKDFEALYLQKKTLSPIARILLGVGGALGALYFGYMTWRDGAQLTRIGYLMICSVMLVLAASRPGKRPDETVAKYRKHYLNRRATMKVDDEAVELHLEGQKNYARSPFKEIYALYDTDECLYWVVKGRAYYILPISAIEDGQVEALKKHLQKKCGKKFQHYETTKA